MKKTFVFLALFFFCTSRVFASFSVTTPPACVTSGTRIDISWAKSTLPSADHYAVTYRTDNLTPPAWINSPGSWVIAHNFGDVNLNTLAWISPKINSNTVKIWVEVHKKNDNRLDISSSNSFKILTSCAGAPQKPPASPKPPTTNSPTPIPSIAKETTSATTAAFQEETKATHSATNSAKNNVNVPTKVKSQKTIGMLYLGLTSAFFIFAVGWVFWKKKLNPVILKPKEVSQPVEKNLPLPDPSKKEELTVTDLENLREKEELPPPTGG